MLKLFVALRIKPNSQNQLFCCDLYQTSKTSLGHQTPLGVSG